VKEYTDSFRKEMVRKLLAPGAPSASSLSRTTGVSEATLSRWLTNARSAASMTKKPKKWTASEKLRVVIEASKLDDAALGELLRREGVHEAMLKQWRADAEAALRDDSPRAQRASQEAKRIKQLQGELHRKERALAEASALLLLKKKVSAIWGDEDDSTPEKSES